MSSIVTGRTRLAVLAVDLAVLIGGVVGLSTIGPSSRNGRDVVSADRGPTGVRGDWQGSTGTSLPNGVELGSTTTTAARVRGGTSTTSANSTRTTPPPAPASPEGLAATREGVYETRVTDEDEGEEPTVETEIVTVRTSQRTASEVRQVHTSRDPEFDEDDEGDDQEYRWTKDALFVVAPVDDPSECSPKELRWLKLPLAAGSSWSDRMECRYDPDPDDPEDEGYSVELRLTSKVTGSREVQAAGRTLFVWEIETEMRSRGEGGSAAFDSVLTRHTQFSPELGFEVRAVEEHRAEGGDSTDFSYRSTTELVKAP